MSSDVFALIIGWWMVWMAGGAVVITAAGALGYALERWRIINLLIMPNKFMLAFFRYGVFIVSVHIVREDWRERLSDEYSVWAWRGSSLFVIIGKIRP